jgi:hypothetical protein
MLEDREARGMRDSTRITRWQSHLGGEGAGRLGEIEEALNDLGGGAVDTAVDSLAGDVVHAAGKRLDEVGMRGDGVRERGTVLRASLVEGRPRGAPDPEVLGTHLKVEEQGR